MPNALDTLTVDVFQPRLGDFFRIHLNQDSAIDAELIEARALSTAANGRRAPFALSFRTPQLAALPQRIYEVAHHEMGAYEIFLVPIGPDEKGMVYEAIFT